MQLVLYLTPSAVTFTQPKDGGPYPWLMEVGSLRLKVRAGFLPSIGSTETPSILVNMDNTGKQVSSVIRRPLRRKAEVYADDGSLLFSGVVAGIAYGSVIILSLES
jgi:hypothetical protein